MPEISATSGAVQSMLVRNSDDDTARTATLLKKSLASDMSMVQTLLPPTPAPQGRVDIKA